MASADFSFAACLRRRERASKQHLIANGQKVSVHCQLAAVNANQSSFGVVFCDVKLSDQFRAAGQ